MLKTVIKQFWPNIPQPQKVMFNVVNTGTLVKWSVLYYTLISDSDSSWCPQLITNQVSEKLLLRFIKSQQLKAAGQISAASDLKSASPERRAIIHSCPSLNYMQMTSGCYKIAHLHTQPEIQKNSDWISIQSMLSYIFIFYYQFGHFDSHFRNHQCLYNIWHQSIK